ncbi:uncharacterized protein LOC144113647 isoform X1 [Amblyomma americanum]
MSEGQDHHKRMPTTQVATVGSANAAEGQPGAVMTSSQQRPCYSDLLDSIRKIHDKLITLTLKLIFKLQVCENAEASNQVLGGRLNDPQQRIVELMADNAQCHLNMQRLVEEHSNVLADNESLVLQHRTEKEEKDQLIAQLRMLASKLCDLSDLDDRSALKLIEALGSAVQQLRDERTSLNDRERAAKTTIEALTGERDALMAENRVLAEKQKDYNELQQAKESLEDHLTIYKDVAKNITREVHHQLTSAMGTLKQVIQESTIAEGPFEATLQTVEREAVRLRTQISLFYDHWSHSERVTSDMSDELARKKEEVQRLSAECARMDSVIREQMAEIEGLCSGITNFEQLAADSAGDLARVQAEAESLKESLAAAQMEAEEREEAALLLLKKDTQIAQLEGKLQEKREELASLVQEKVAAVDESERFREVNQNLKEIVFSLSKQLEQEQNRRESMVTDAVQTDGCLVPKADCEVQTSGNYDELLLKLESSEHEVNLLKSSIHRICCDNAALSSMYKECRGELTKASEICHALEDQLKRLAEELKAVNTDKEALLVKTPVKASPRKEKHPGSEAKQSSTSVSSVPLKMAGSRCRVAPEQKTVDVSGEAVWMTASGIAEAVGNVRVRSFRGSAVPASSKKPKLEKKGD